MICKSYRTNTPTPDFNIIAETPKSFRRFDRIKIEDLKKEIISEINRTDDMDFRNELAAIKKKCKKLVSMSNQYSKICVEKLEKEITRKDDMLD